MPKSSIEICTPSAQSLVHDRERVGLVWLEDDRRTVVNVGDTLVSLNDDYGTGAYPLTCLRTVRGVPLEANVMGSPSVRVKYVGKQSGCSDPLGVSRRRHETPPL